MPYGIGNIKAGGNKGLQGASLIPYKVLDIILDNDHSSAKEYGNWDAVGTISCISIIDLYKNIALETNPKFGAFNTACPLFPNQKLYPLKGEVVLVFQSIGIGGLSGGSKNYYLNPVNLWNHPHHNSIPNLNAYRAENPKSSISKVKLSNQGVLVSNKGVDLPDELFGEYFDESLEIKPLLPFEGDHIIEGRYGNSIRFGATARGMVTQSNDWSEVGNVGDPITIIRNGQPDEYKDDPQGYVPTVEDINRDQSTIYLTSTQKLTSFIPASTNWQSWGAKLTIVEDPILSLSSPPLPEVVEEETTLVGPEEEGLGDDWGSAEDDNNEEESVVTTPAEIEEEEDELSLYDELIESGDYQDDDFDDYLTPEELGNELTPTDLAGNPFNSSTWGGSLDINSITTSGNIQVPLLSQQDDAWGSITTWHKKNSKLTYARAGCANLSCCMIASYYLDRIVTPQEMAGNLNNSDVNDNTPNGTGVMVEWHWFNKKIGDGAKKRYYPSSSGITDGDAAIKWLIGKLDAGHPILWMKKWNPTQKSEKIYAYGTDKAYTKTRAYAGGTQHWMVIVGYNASVDENSNPTFQINDPAGGSFRGTVPAEHLCFPTKSASTKDAAKTAGSYFIYFK